jgi:dTDP-4-dehydrorhamnose reductase
MNILITGANGQLGSELKKLAAFAPQTTLFTFTDIDELDITDSTAVKFFFEQNQFDFCINAAAYTAVDKAESEQEKAQLINVEAVRIIAEQCSLHHVVFIHISTDYVFGGKNYLPYKEDDMTSPTSIYGKTKLLGEQVALQENPQTIVIRTSWLYSTFGHNFMKTMLRLSETKLSIGVVADQIGTPTYAEDLAQTILQMIDYLKESTNRKDFFGIYHYSNEGVASWYDFAYAIFEMKNIKIALSPIRTTEYPTPATRPAYSILDKGKIKNVFGILIPHWRESLKRCLNGLE